MTGRDHTCDRKGPPAKVIDDPDGESITRIYPTCSACGVPQVFTDEERAAPRRATATLHSSKREMPAVSTDITSATMDSHVAS